MKLQDSQLDYLNKRKKSYNLKYSILKNVIQKNLREGTRVLELFGGVGLTTGLIQEIKPSYHEVIEINEGCYSELIKKFGMKRNLKIIKTDAFEYKNFKNFSWIFLDNAYTIKRDDSFKSLFNNIKTFSPNAELFLTETGVYNLNFIKSQDKFEEYYSRVCKFLNENYGFFVNQVCYTNQFSILHIKQKPCKLKLIKWEGQNECWKEYL